MDQEGLKYDYLKITAYKNRQNVIAKVIYIILELEVSTRIVIMTRANVITTLTTMISKHTRVISTLIV
jgi:hypothetical protein